MGHYSEAFSEGVGHDIVAEVGVGSSITAKVALILVQQGDQHIPLEDVDPHGSFEGG